MNEINESDWKLFKARIADWQERFMGKLVAEYASVMQDETKAASERFWSVEKRINKDKQLSGVICERKRSSLLRNMITLYAEGAITDEDLDGFSDELVRTVKVYNKYIDTHH